MNPSIYVGIDVSSKKLDIFIDQPGVLEVIPNTKKAWTELTERLTELKPERIILEPTGKYEKGVMKALQKANLPVVRIDGLQVRSFARAAGQRAKTDRIDAQMLAQYGRCLPTEVSQPLSEAREHLQELKRYRDHLSKALIGLQNVCRKSEYTEALVKSHVEQMKKNMLEVEQQIKEEVKKNAAFEQQVNLLCTTPGIGFISAVAILAEIPELGELKPKKLASLLGIAPYVKESGKYKGQGRIYGGRRRARIALYMPTLVATRSNRDIKEFYERLKEKGKASKLALIACMRKLACRLNAMMREKKPWAYFEAKVQEVS